jgi:hypothetical protein
MSFLRYTESSDEQRLYLHHRSKGNAGANKRSLHKCQMPIFLIM